MYSFVSSDLGLIHLISAFVAMAAGAFVLAGRKGTPLHKRAGYFYASSMLVVCGTAMGIYDLTGYFGVFHVAAVVGFVTLAAGIVPMLIKGLDRKKKAVHLWFMYYSVLGLYAALASELIVRIPDKPFYPMVGIATGAVMLVGTTFMLWKERVWIRHFT